MNKNWVCVKAKFSEKPEDWSAVHEIFASHDCAGTVEEDNPPSMHAYVYQDEDAAKRIGELGNHLLDFGASQIEITIVPEEDWGETWKQFFVAREVGDRFLIQPSWEEGKPTNRTVIELDPGQAFGTGEHPTTRLCIELLEEYVKPGYRVLDLGTGSGVLSIAAFTLSTMTVHATEVEPNAVEAARSNCERNRADVIIEETETIPKNWMNFDIVVSNIVSAVLIRLASSVRSAIAETGVWIVSGIISDNWQDVLSSAERVGFRLVQRKEEDGWIAATLQPVESIR